MGILTYRIFMPKKSLQESIWRRIYGFQFMINCW
jgi:hypothetical protein